MFDIWRVNGIQLCENRSRFTDIPSTSTIPVFGPRLRPHYTTFFDVRMRSGHLVWKQRYFFAVLRYLFVSEIDISRPFLTSFCMRWHWFSAAWLRTDPLQNLFSRSFLSNAYTPPYISALLYRKRASFFTEPPQGRFARSFSPLPAGFFCQIDP